MSGGRLEEAPPAFLRPPDLNAESRSGCEDDAYGQDAPVSLQLACALRDNHARIIPHEHIADCETLGYIHENPVELRRAFMQPSQGAAQIEFLPSPTQRLLALFDVIILLLIRPSEQRTSQH